ncbi:MAG: hypothetical protein U0525_01745 [Patescibacteria group bacterium]
MTDLTKERVSRLGPLESTINLDLVPPKIIEGSVFTNNSLAFNLSSEWDRAKEQGDAYAPTFIDNAHFYAGETYIRGRAAVFDYNIVNGRLKYPKSDIDAIESFAKPMVDRSRPAWLRERDRKDLQVIEKITEDLPNAKAMESVWIAASPAIPDSDVPYDERREWGYGRHNFLFLHQVQVDSKTGQKKLVCRALRNYLSVESQRKLIESLSGRPIPNDIDLHGYVAKLSSSQMTRQFAIQDSMHIAHIHSAGERIAKTSGDKYWLNEEGDLSGDAEMNEARIIQELSKLDWWLEDVYGDISNLGNNPKPQDFQVIELKFKGWEAAVRKIAEGEKLDSSLTARPKLDKYKNIFKTTLDYNDPRLPLMIASRTMQGGIGTCGVGSGFGNIVPGQVRGDEIAMFGIHPIMSAWSGIAHGIPSGEYKKETPTHYESYKCPGCQKWLSGESKSDKKSWRTGCEHCGHKLNC